MQLGRQIDIIAEDRLSWRYKVWTCKTSFKMWVVKLSYHAVLFAISVVEPSCSRFMCQLVLHGVLPSQVELKVLFLHLAFHLCMYDNTFFFLVLKLNLLLFCCQHRNLIIPILTSASKRKIKGNPKLFV